ncbi:MAG: SH3 beta-barrel fold-containing protein [Nitrososphaeraceae archaeon]
MYREELRKHICKVVFEKQYGREKGQFRTMICTLKQDYIDQHNLTPVGGGYVVPDHQIRCVDIEKNEWRSFTIDSVISFDIIE